MHVGQYQASSTVLGWPGDGDCHVILVSVGINLDALMFPMCLFTFSIVSRSKLVLDFHMSHILEGVIIDIHLDQSARHQWHLVRVSLNSHCKHVSQQLFLIVFHHASQILISCELFCAMGSSFDDPICPTRGMHAHTCSPKRGGHSCACMIVCFKWTEYIPYLESFHVYKHWGWEGGSGTHKYTCTWVRQVIWQFVPFYLHTLVALCLESLELHTESGWSWLSMTQTSM